MEVSFTLPNTETSRLYEGKNNHSLTSNQPLQFSGIFLIFSAIFWPVSSRYGLELKWDFREGQSSRLDRERTLRARGAEKNRAGGWLWKDEKGQIFFWRRVRQDGHWELKNPIMVRSLSMIFLLQLCPWTLEDMTYPLWVVVGWTFWGRKWYFRNLGEIFYVHILTTCVRRRWDFEEWTVYIHRWECRCVKNAYKWFSLWTRGKHRQMELLRLSM